MGDVVTLRRDRPAIVQQNVRPLREARAHFVNDFDGAAEFMRWLGERGRDQISVDTETTGLDRTRDRVRLVQVGDAMDGWAIPFETAGWGGLMKDVVSRFTGFYRMHNAPFDWTMLAKHGVVVPRRKIHDTRIMQHVLTSTGSLALKSIAQRLVDPNANAAQEALQTGIGAHGGWTWDNVPTDFQPYWVYGALDTVLTHRVGDVLYPQVMREAPLSYELEMQVLWVCVDMEIRGARIDRVYTQQLYDKLTTYVHSAERWITDNYHVPPGSNKVADILQRDGVKLWKMTDTGKYSLDKEVLEEIDHPLAQTVLARRRAEKVVSTYLTHYLTLADGADRVHANINTVGGSAKNPFEPGGARGVRTGRMSMNDPNLQNVPVRTDQGKKIRNCFIATDEDHEWIKYDAEQIEARIFAHLAADQRLIETFRHAKEQAADMFTLTAREIFHDASIPKSDDRRQHTKNSFYAIIYSAGVEQFARTAGIRDTSGHLDLGAASVFLQRLHATYPGIKDLQRKIEREATQRRASEGVAYVRSPLTSRKFTADEGREYALMNYLIQGVAGEVLKLKIVQADNAGLGEFMLFPVHDELDIDVPKSQLGDVITTLNDVMNDDDLLSVPITWTSEHGPRWGECE